MVVIKRNKQSRTSSRPILKTKKQGKLKLLKKDELALQRKIAEEGLSKRATAPKGNIALKASEDKAFKKKTKSFKKVRVPGGKKGVAVTAKKGKQNKGRGGKGRRRKLQEDHGLICLTNLPDGFFEDQLQNYFSQFGNVLRVRLVRSKKTGRSCGYGYVEFQHSEVANVVTKVMHNYLTFGKIIKCINMEYNTGLADSIFSVKHFGPGNCPKVISRTQAILELNKPRTAEQLEGRKKRVVNTFNKKMKLLSSLGINLDIQMAKPEGSKTLGGKKKETDSQNAAKEKGSEKAKEAEVNENTALQTSKKKGKVLTNKELRGLKRGLDSFEENETTTSQETKVNENNNLPAKSPKKRKSDVTEVKTPQSTKKSQKKDNIKTPKGQEGTLISSTNEARDSSSAENEELVFEADESDDEITFKTPPFAKKKLVKITPLTPAIKVKPNSSKASPLRTTQGKKK